MLEKKERNNPTKGKPGQKAVDRAEEKAAEAAEAPEVEEAPAAEEDAATEDA